MNDPRLSRQQKSWTTHLPAEGSDGFRGEFTLRGHVPPLVHVSTSIHTRGMGLMQQEIA